MSSPPNATWRTAADLGDEWTHAPGKFLLGHDGDLRHVGKRTIGYWDNRHLMTIGGSRSGKTKTLVIPNVRDYPGSIVVVDPKGEIAKATFADREKLGPAYILNPFARENEELPASNSYNPFDEFLKAPYDSQPADAAQIANALIQATTGDQHWTDSAKNMIIGALLFAAQGNDEYATIHGMRTLLSNMTLATQSWEAMANNPDAYDGRLQIIGQTLLSKLGRETGGSFGADAAELRSIQSVALEQTRSLDDVAAISMRSDFSLSDFSGNKPVTIYLVLPGMRLVTHSRWLRLMIYQLFAALERSPLEVNPKAGRWPLRLVLEEFPVLGNVPAIETAAGYMAGFGVQLWVILQDLTQLKRHYKESWETFLGNAGIITAFNVVDVTTTKYLAELLGTRTVQERRNVHVTSGAMASGHPGFESSPRSVPLLEPAEIALHFARETGRTLVMIPESPPIYLQRFPHEPIA